MVVLAPVPVILPGLIVQVPVAGKPVNKTLPVAKAQVGCAIVPTAGAEGAAVCELITTGAEATEVQVDTSVTVKL